MNELTQQENINSNVAVFSPQSLAAIQTFSQVMASGMATVPEHLRGNPSDCMAITMQAMQWQMNPYAVAQKTFVVNGVLGYEAQLVNAVISTRGPLTGRIEYDWFGPWEKIIGKFEIRKNDKGKEYRVPGWKLADENGIGVRVQATLRGESKPRVLELLLAQARTRNSTLWADDPRQQLAYLALKRWARLYCPEVILGVYTGTNWTNHRKKSLIRFRNIKTHPPAVRNVKQQLLSKMPGKTGSVLSVNVLSRHKAPEKQQHFARKWKIIKIHLALSTQNLKEKWFSVITVSMLLPVLRR